MTKKITYTIILLCSVILFYVNRSIIIDETLLLFLGDTTIYSKKYSEKNFNRIQEGQDYKEVISKLGPPIYFDEIQNKNGNKEVLMEYTRSSSDSHYRIRIIVIQDGKVSNKIKSTHID